MLINDPKLGAKIKLKLLAHGVQDNKIAFADNVHYKEEHYAYDNGNWGVDHPVPSEMMLPGDIVCKVHVRPDSSLKIVYDAKDGTLYVCEDNKYLCPCVFLPRPNFWNYKTSSGMPTMRLAHFYGKDCLNFSIFSGCEFMSIGKLPCRFCSVVNTQKSHNTVEVFKSVEDLADVCRLAVKHDKVRYFLMTGGSTIDRKKEFNNHIAVLSAIRHILPWNGSIKGNVSFLPPDDMEMLREIKEVGVDNPSFNFEVWPKKAFEYFCPGKQKYVGFEYILQCYDFLVNLYGPGKVWCNFVAGLVPLEDIKSGFTEMAARGVIPGANVYHPEVGSVLGGTMKSPNEDFIKALYLHAAELYHKYGYHPFYDASVLRNSMANEAFNGWLE